MMARKRNEPTKDFIAYKGPGKLQIVPQTPRGWRYFALWMLAILAPIVVFLLLAIEVDETPNEKMMFWAIIPMFLLMGFLTWRMAKWMLARAEVIDFADFAEWKRQKVRKGER